MLLSILYQVLDVFQMLILFMVTLFLMLLAIFFLNHVLIILLSFPGLFKRVLVDLPQTHW
jgi:hypothetical protein